jgi:hypothetical protein
MGQSDLFVGGSVRFPRRAAWLRDSSHGVSRGHDDLVDPLTHGLASGRVRRGEFSVGFVKGLN